MANCTYTCCDIVKTGVAVINQKKYGVNCTPQRFCRFSEYYRNVQNCTPFPSPADVVYEKKIVQFLNHICQLVEPTGTYAMCEEAQLVFSSYENNLIGKLTVGGVISLTGAIIGDYIIDWHLDSPIGNIVFISGVGSYPDIQAIHPFVDELVEGGNLYPIVREISLNGEIYSPILDETEEILFSPDLINCLPSIEIPYITVENYNCGNGNLENNSYSHSISFNAITDPALNANRTIKFILNTDGSSSYFAYYFYTVNVADRIIINYIKASDEENPILLKDIIVGLNLVHTNYNLTPVEIAYPYTKGVLNLTSIEYEEGDYLLISILPRVKEPENFDTNWLLAFKCLSVFECLDLLEGCNVIDPSTIEMTLNPDGCTYYLTVETLATAPDINFSSFTDIYNYLSGYGSGTNIVKTGNSYTYTGNRTGYNCNGIPVNYSLGCVELLGELNFEKIGNIITLSYSNETDYLSHKNIYTTLKDTYFLESYVPTQIEYYTALRIYFKDGNSCGDNIVNSGYGMHMSSPTIFDDENYIITIEMLTVTNELPYPACDPAMDAVDSEIGSWNYYIALPNISLYTNISASNLFYGYVYSHVEAPIDQFFYYRLRMLTEGLEVCPNNLWQHFPNSYYADIYTIYLRVQITDNDDPVNNFKVINYNIFPKVIYEIVNGVILIPIPE